MSESSDSTTEPANNQLDFKTIEDVIDIGQSYLDDAEDAVGDVLCEDLDDLDDKLELIEDAVDDAQDDQGDNPLGPVPAVIDYTQTLFDIIRDETEIEAIADAAETVETVEEHFEDVDVTQTKWYADVNGIPVLFNNQEVSPARLIEAGDIDDDHNVEDYTLHILPTRSAELDESDMTVAHDSPPLDLDEYRHFATEKSDGGVV
jgi:hypothetical protein